jgi:hypothetical protein
MHTKQDTSPEALLKHITRLETQIFALKRELRLVIEFANDSVEHNRFLDSLERLQQIQKRISR